MAISNYERVGRAMELLRNGVGAFVEREMESAHGEKAQLQASYIIENSPQLAGKSILEYDIAALLKLMWKGWNEIFARTLGHAERSLVSELREARNRWAHQQNFTTDDAYRALDSAHRLLTAVSAPEAAEIEKMKGELMRQKFDEQVRNEKRKAGGSLVETGVTGTLKPWREVVTPHPDVSGGRYQQAEFAADLWQVHLGEGGDEYRNPTEFFRRTYLTESLKRLLVGAVKRLSGNGGDPVVQLQTNFGGGKTHSMLALYHLVSGTPAKDLPGVDALLAEHDLTNLPQAKRVVLVGNKISPGNPSKKQDGTEVRTLWGELAWQLGGAEAYARIAKDDERATNPGDLLRELFVTYGPSLILIDEWVAYARQLHDDMELPGGRFDTMFSFAQALTESAKLAKNCLLVVSLPASDTAGSPHTHADDAEVGGVRGRESLDRLRNVIGRVESSWRAATAEEGFEIVRRRLFEPMLDEEAFTSRNTTARAFSDLYRAGKAEFPPECSKGEYEKRIQAAYPIHPEIFDRLYGDWSTLVKFQRTRGVLRLMAAVIHALWRDGDRSPLILPSTIPIDEQGVQWELTRYLSDQWAPIIERDVDGAQSLPLALDNQVASLGKVHAARRVARTIYLGSAPTSDAAHRGLEDRRVKLGCVMPGESTGVFGDALRRLASEATYLYQDGSRYWYATQPTVTKLAEDRAEQLTRNSDRVGEEIDRLLREDVKTRGDFARVYPAPRSSADVADELETRLVVLPHESCHSKDGESEAIALAKSILESRGTTPRLYRNTLVFLAADRVRLQDFDEAVRRYLAWQSIVDERDTLNLDPHQSRQAENQRDNAKATVAARLPETYHWALVPTQKDATEPIEWETVKLSGNDPLALRASNRLRKDDLLIKTLGGSVLRRHMDKVPLWRGDHVAVRQLVEDFASYLYLPRLVGPGVLGATISDGLGATDWETNTFAYAETYDEATGRYSGITTGQLRHIQHDDPGLVVRPSVIQAQILEDEKRRMEQVAAVQSAGTTSSNGNGGAVHAATDEGVVAAPPQLRHRRYYGSVELDPLRVGGDAARIAEEVIGHLAALPGARVRVTLEIEAEIDEGAPEQVVRTVNENSRTLKFGTFEFERG